MIRKLKILGPALVAALAIGAAADSVAQAGEFTAGANPAVVTGEQVTHGGGELNVFASGLRKTQCKTALFEGTSSFPTKTLTIEPTYSNCETAGLPETITMNGCDFLFNEPHTSAGQTDYEGTANLLCPAGKVVELHAYSSAANHTAGVSLCTKTFEPAQNLSKVTYTNVAGSPDHITMTIELINMPVKIHGSPLICGTATTGTYTGAITLKAYKDEAVVGQPYKHGSQINATVSGS